MPPIDLVDLRIQPQSLKQEILQKFGRIIDRAAFVAGEEVRGFEESWAGYLGVKHCLAVNNGTSALFLILRALGIGLGDEVIVPVNTFIATAEAVSLAGARPVFIDIEESTYLLDPSKLEEAVTPRTKAIIIVHLYGQCADMEAVSAVASRRGLSVIEDACQAHGAEYKGRKAGSLGLAAAFSFYPSKNLGAWGEAGAVTTDNDALADQIRLLRDHGSRNKYQHEIIGGNFRLEEFQAAVLTTKLPHLDEWNDRRRERAQWYLELLRDIPQIKLPAASAGNRQVWHIFAVRANERDRLRDFLKMQGIATGIHYPLPVHLTEAYSHLGYKRGDFPVAERVAGEILSLPMYPELTRPEIEFVAEQIRKFYGA